VCATPADSLKHVADQVKLVVVTGSGRSGTSSVAGALKRLGLYIPQPEVETDERNPRGYYEPLWVAEFHKWLLNPLPVRTIDSRPNAGRIAKKAVTPKVEDELRTWLRDQLALVAERGENQILLKDTRAYWVYDLWQRMAREFGAQLTSLTMLRHPAQVVRSRDAAYLTEMDRSFRRQRETTNVAAWINAAFETERVTRGNPRAFVPYYDLIGDWRAAMTRAGAQLGLAFNDMSGHHPVDDFIDADLNRSRPAWDGLEVAPALIDLADRSWDAMNALVETPDDPDAMKRTDALGHEYVEMYESAAAIALDETTAQVAKVRRKLKKQLAEAEAEIERLKA
jgi:hypothetical protein